MYPILDTRVVEVNTGSIKTTTICSSFHLPKGVYLI